MNFKFELGDKVRIVDSQKNKDMKILIGQQTTIRSRFYGVWSKNLYSENNKCIPINNKNTYILNNNPFSWHENWLEKVESNFLTDEDILI